MSKKFDPYHRWLGIAPQQQPPHYYRLLGLQQFEEDADVIQSAADRQRAHVHGFHSGKHADDAHRLLNEISAATLVLLCPAEKAAYDAKLQATIDEAKRLRRQQRKLATADALAPAAPPVVPTPVIRTRHPQRGNNLNVPILAGVAVIACVLLIGGAIATVQPWESPAVVANESDVTPMPAVVPPPPVPRRDNVGEQPPANTTDDDRFELPPEPEPEPEPKAPLKDLDDAGDVPPEEPAEPPKKPAIPDVVDQIAMTKKIVAEFSLNDAKTEQEKINHAAKLLRSAEATTKAPGYQFVQLTLARDLAADAADARFAFQAIAAMESRFDIDGPAMRKAALTRSLDAEVHLDQKKDAISVGRQLVDEMIQRDAFDDADATIVKLMDVARRYPDKTLLTKLKERREDAKLLGVAYGKVAADIETLELAPKHAAANLAVGRYHLFTKGDWKQALPKLANSDDVVIRRIATGETDSPTAAEAMKKLADDWWEFSERERGTFEANFCRARAGFWYEQVVDRLEGIDMITAAQRLRESRAAMRGMLPAEKTFLDDIQEGTSHVGWGQLAKHGNDCEREGKMTFRGKTPPHALYTHAAEGNRQNFGVAFVEYRLNGLYDRFETIAGIWDGPRASESPLVFQVDGDGQTLWQSGRLQKQGVGQMVNVDVRGVELLTLRVVCAGKAGGAWSAWIQPQVQRIHTAGTSPISDFGLFERHGSNAPVPEEEEELNLGIFSRPPAEFRRDKK